MIGDGDAFEPNDFFAENTGFLGLEKLDLSDSQVSILEANVETHEPNPSNAHVVIL